MKIEEFLAALEQAQSSESAGTFEVWATLKEFIDSNLTTFYEYYCVLISSTNVNLHIKKLLLILFHQMFLDGAEKPIPQEHFEKIFAITISLFPIPDITTVSLAAQLCSDLLKLELYDDSSSSIICTLSNSLTSVESQYEVFGFSLLLLDLSSTYILTPEESTSILFSILKCLASESIDNSIKLQCLQIFKIIIEDLEENTPISEIVSLLLTISKDSIILNEVYLCLSEIIINFPNFSEMIFNFVFQNVIENLNSISGLIESICRFLESFFIYSQSLPSDEIISLLFNHLMIIMEKLYKNECDIKTYEIDDTIYSCVKTISKRTKNIPLLLSIFEANITSTFCVKQYISLVSLICAFKCGLNEFPSEYMNLITILLENEVPRIRFYAFKCFKNMLNLINPDLIFGIIEKHINDIEPVQYQLLRILYFLSYNMKFINQIFDIYLFYLKSMNPYITISASNFIRKIIRKLNVESSELLLQKVLIMYSQCLNTQQFLNTLPSLLTYIQSIALKLQKNFIKYSKDSIGLILTTLQLGDEFVFDAAITLSAIGYTIENEFIGFLPNLCQTMLQAFQRNYLDESSIDAISTSLFFIIQKFDISEIIPYFIQIFIQSFLETKNLEIISAISDISEKYPQIVLNFNQQIIEIISLSIEYIDRMNEKIQNDLNSLLKMYINISEQNNLILQIAFKVIEAEFDSEIGIQLFSSLSLLVTIAYKAPEILFEYVKENNWIFELIENGIKDEESHRYALALAKIFGINQSNQ